MGSFSIRVSEGDSVVWVGFGIWRILEGREGGEGLEGMVWRWDREERRSGGEWRRRERRERRWRDSEKAALMAQSKGQRERERPSEKEGFTKKTRREIPMEQEEHVITIVTVNIHWDLRLEKLIR